MGGYKCTGLEILLIWVTTLPYLVDKCYKKFKQKILPGTLPFL